MLSLQSLSIRNLILNTTSPDEIVTIEITKATETARRPGTKIQLRVIKVELPTGEIETLLTIKLDCPYSTYLKMNFNFCDTIIAGFLDQTEYVCVVILMDIKRILKAGR
ncbi:hypothetical protein B5M42_002290 [Paenibacillus athensensis]|uniref:Uncharacterized protein n=1 Tax=Paenibacillus athensensis TaxID=1967502 RepID=A0A4Y8QAG3_9BACL|nr:hypothetical protein [Paenibacillus athensensis]MCD1257668.1 hypothetical protein [Paenibacillus athensensis]